MECLLHHMKIRKKELKPQWNIDFWGIFSISGWKRNGRLVIIEGLAPKMEHGCLRAGKWKSAMYVYPPRHKEIAKERKIEGLLYHIRIRERIKATVVY